MINLLFKNKQTKSPPQIAYLRHNFLPMAVSCICKQNILGHLVFQILCKEYFCFLDAWEVEGKKSLFHIIKHRSVTGLIGKMRSWLLFSQNFLPFSMNITFKWTWLTGIYRPQHLQALLYPSGKYGRSVTPSSRFSSSCTKSSISHRSVSTVPFTSATRPEPTLWRKYGLVGLGVRVNTEFFPPLQPQYVYVGTLWPSSKCVLFSQWPVLSLCLNRLPPKWLFSVWVQRGTGLGSFFYKQLYHRNGEMGSFSFHLLWQQNLSRMWKPDPWLP